jgi:hypothetical protein
VTAPRELLDQLDALRADATPGPWQAATAPAEGSDETHAEYLTNALRPDEGNPLWVAWAPVVNGVHNDVEYVVPVVTGDGPTSGDNARYIAAAHEALPQLTAALRAVLDLADELERERGSVQGNVARLFAANGIRAAIAAALAPADTTGGAS